MAGMVQGTAAAFTVPASASRAPANPPPQQQFALEGSQLSQHLRAAAAAATAQSPSQAPATALAAVAAAAALASAGVSLVGRRSRTATSSRSQVVACQAFENELGVQSPVGFYDPVGFTADGDVAAFRRRRSVELKHGRISMLACMGFMTPEITGKWPGYLSPSLDLKFADIPNGLAAFSKMPALGWAQIAAYMGFVELSGGFDDYRAGGTPGDYGWKALTSSDPAERTKKLQAELANGRLAMIAIIAMFVQNGITGTTGPLMWMGQEPTGRAF